MCPFCKVPLTKRHGIYIFPLCGMQFIDEENFEDFKIRTFEENLEVKEEYDQHDYTKLSTGLEATFTASVKVSKDVRVQLYKACKFFDFCSKDKLYSSFLDSFCIDRGVASWQDYILRLFNFYHASINNPWIKVEGKESAHQAFCPQGAAYC